MKNGQVERCATGRALLSSRTAVWCSKKSFVRRQKGVDGREPELTLGGPSLGPLRSERVERTGRRERVEDTETSPIEFRRGPQPIH